MPEFFDVVRSLRGVRYYKPDPVPQAVLEQVLEAATRAPSGSNKQPWRFVVVRDGATKRALGELYRKGRAASYAGEPEPIPAQGPYTFEQDMEHVPVIILPCMEALPTRGREVFRGASIYPAVQNLMLAAAAHGLGSRFTTVWQHTGDAVPQLLGIPDNFEVMGLLPLGYPAAPDHLGGAKRRPVAEVTYYDRWGSTSPRA
jgi:nitroreductase